MFDSENLLLNQIKQKYSLNIEGILALDEVGRGCVAGPVIVCASLWVKGNKSDLQSFVQHIKDSKKLTSSKRLSCYKDVLNYFEYDSKTIPLKNSTSIPHVTLVKSNFSIPFQDLLYLKEQNYFVCIGFCIGESCISEVEEFNIWGAVQIAAGRALLGLKDVLLDKFPKYSSQIIILTDGHLSFKIPEFLIQNLQVTAVKGDDLFKSIGLSSILAKVYRDLYMESQDFIYPQFNFAKHKGYGTSLHIKNILEYGTCSLHRQSFLKKYL